MDFGGGYTLKLAALAIALALPSVAFAAAEADPIWAFLTMGTSPPPAAGAEPHSLPGSSQHYTDAQIDDLKNPPDWFPDEHPPMPTVVAHAKLFACASCHLASGMGHPESSGLAGLSATYMERQITDFASGARRNPVVIDGKPQANATAVMTVIAKMLSPEDSAAAAAYFAALKPLDWVKVVETPTVPKSYVDTGYMRVLSPGGGTEPINGQIVELAQDQTRQLLRDPHSGTIAYVPPGSLARGAKLVAANACAGCHGAGLVGAADAPHIAGRSPLYIVRQLYAFKVGARTGPYADMMQPAVAKLDTADMVAVAAYVASLKP